MSELIPNRWWAALPSTTLRSSRPRGVTRLGQSLVLWRDGDGRACAALAACPHRGADLSLGRVVEGQLQCPYHGFRFQPDGACSRIPCEGSAAKIPPRLQLSLAHVEEAHGFVWVYAGDEDAREATPLPWIADAPEPGGDEAVREMTWDVRFSRVMEGMLDLHHFPFAHRRFTPPGYTRLDPYEAAVDDDGVLRTTGRLRRERAPESGFVMHIDVAFPGTLSVRFSEAIGGVVVCTPIDEERTYIALRYRARVPVLGALPFVNRLAAELSVVAEMRLIQPDDYRMLRSTTPRTGGPEQGQLVHADKGVALWHGLKRRAMQGQLPVLGERDESRRAPLSF